jgi:nitrogen fixation protein
MNPWGNGNAIIPSVAVEFDTYYNFRQNDPESDHVAYLENGVSFHEEFWNGGDPEFNMEDNRLHDFRFRWDPSTNTITVMLDGFTVFMGKKDLVNEIFEGNNEVIWGFSASTGRLHNKQYFCLRRFASVKEISNNENY